MTKTIKPNLSNDNISQKTLTYTNASKAPARVELQNKDASLNKEDMRYTRGTTKIDLYNEKPVKNDVLYRLNNNKPAQTQSTGATESKGVISRIYHLIRDTAKPTLSEARDYVEGKILSIFDKIGLAKNKDRDDNLDIEPTLVDYDTENNPLPEEVTTVPNEVELPPHAHGGGEPSLETTTKPTTTEPTTKEETTTEPTTKKDSGIPTESPDLPYLDGNVIDASKPLYQAEGYNNLSEEELEFLAKVAFREQRTIEGVRVSLSTMANQYEDNKSQYEDVYDYVRRSGWYGRGGGSFDNQFYKEYTESKKAELYEVVKDVMIDGNRYVPRSADNHDNLGDIRKAYNDGVLIDKNDRSQYIPGKTKIYNEYGSIYVFQGFAPNKGDPYGDTVGQWNPN